MSVMGDKAAVVSLGMSCQTSEQIRTHAALIAQLCGDPTMAPANMPFDNLICMPSAATRMLDADAFHPDDPRELTVSNGAFWTARQVWFWHEYRLHKRHILEYLRGRVNTKRAWRALSGKYAHLAARFRTLRARQRLVFVISGSQNNLAEVLKDSSLRPLIEASDVERLCEACDIYMGRRCDYILATYPQRLAGTPRRDRLRYVPLRPDGSEWAGDPAQWREVFAAALAPTR